QVEQRAEVVPGVLGTLVVVVVLVGLRVLPQRRLVGRGQEPVDGVQRRHRVPGTLLAVVSPRPTGVGQVTTGGVGGVVPVDRRYPVVRPFLLAGRSELRAALVLRRGDERPRVVGGREPVQRKGFLVRGRRVVAPLEAEHRRVVAQRLPDRLGGQLVRRVVRAGVPRRLPEVAALVAGVDQDAG